MLLHSSRSPLFFWYYYLVADLYTSLEAQAVKMTARNVSVVSGHSGQQKTVFQEPITSVLKDGDVPVNPDGEWNADEEVLAALGYKPEFKREFTLWTTFCVSFAVLGLLPSFASTLYYGMGYAGTAGKTTWHFQRIVPG